MSPRETGPAPGFQKPDDRPVQEKRETMVSNHRQTHDDDKR
jgi:hypothetical protein